MLGSWWHNSEQTDRFASEEPFLLCFQLFHRLVPDGIIYELQHPASASASASASALPSRALTAGPDWFATWFCNIWTFSCKSHWRSVWSTSQSSTTLLRCSASANSAVFVNIHPVSKMIIMIIIIADIKSHVTTDPWGAAAFFLLGEQNKAAVCPVKCFLFV